MQIRYHRDDSDLKAIKKLQSLNTMEALSSEDRISEGFVTCIYDTRMLKTMCGAWKHVLAWDAQVLSGYALCMLGSTIESYPILQTMVEQFKVQSWRNRLIIDCDFVVVGQVCVAKGYRKQGVLQAMYAQLQEQFKETFELLITEIDSKNIPSLGAHLRYGFEEIIRYKEQNGRTWVIVGFEL